MRNTDHRTVESFGTEWSRFDQQKVGTEELLRRFEDYFHIFPWETLPDSAVGFDAGCGSGRWAALVASRVGRLHCFDASIQAVEVAQRNLASVENCQVAEASLQDMPIDDSSADFGYSLGVLHHVPDTEAGLRACVEKLKPDAPFLVYLYYAFDNRPAWFQRVWRMSDVLRRGINQLPKGLLALTTDGIATFVYWPAARLCKILEGMGLSVDHFPLSYYRNLSFYSMRTDACDRFGTPIEKRYTASEIKAMMERAGLGDIRMSDRPPYWVAVGRRAA